MPTGVYKRTDAWKDLIRKGMKIFYESPAGKTAKMKISKRHSGKRNSNYHKNFSEETRQKIGNFRRGKSYEEIYGSSENALRIKQVISRGLETSEKHKLAMRDPVRNKKLRDFNLGRKRTQESRRKQSESISGKKNFQWIKDRSLMEYPAEWNKRRKAQVRDRDQHRCQECGMSEAQLGYKLSVHHVDYNKKNCDLTNLISLCHSCHSQTNFSRKEWENYFKNKIQCSTSQQLL